MKYQSHSSVQILRWLGYATAAPPSAYNSMFPLFSLVISSYHHANVPIHIQIASVEESKKYYVG